MTNYFKVVSLRTNTVSPIVFYMVDSFYQKNIATCADYLMNKEIPLFSEERLLDFFRKIIKNDAEKNKIDSLIDPKEYHLYVDLMENGYVVKNGFLFECVPQKYISNLDPIEPLYINKNVLPLWSALLKDEFIYSDITLAGKLQRMLDEDLEKDLLILLSEKMPIFDEMEKTYTFVCFFKEIPIDTPLESLLNTKIAAVSECSIYNGSVFQYKTNVKENSQYSLGVLFPDLSEFENLSHFSQLFKVELVFKS